MTEQIIDPEEILIGYNKFVALKIRQAVANKTENEWLVKFWRSAIYNTFLLERSFYYIEEKLFMF